MKTVEKTKKVESIYEGKVNNIITVENYVRKLIYLLKISY